MALATLRAHFDGQVIQLDEPHKLEPNTRLLVTVLTDDEMLERNFWSEIAIHGLERAYGDSEPDYPLEYIKEPNPEYEGR